MALNLRNGKRARRAAAAIRTEYKNHSGHMVKEDLVDICTDIRHLCDEKGWDFFDILMGAHTHYTQEKEPTT